MSADQEAKKRYSPAMVALHWSIAVLLLFALVMGSTRLPNMDNASPEKLNALRGHMVFGSLICALTLIRLSARLFRLRGAAIRPATELERWVGLGHFGLDVLTLLVVISGAVLARQARLPEALFSGTVALPASFSALAPYQAHYWGTKVMMALIGVHVLAALFHQFIQKDGLLRSMWFPIGNCRWGFKSRD